jgi:hypothetical protein
MRWATERRSTKSSSREKLAVRETPPVTSGGLAPGVPRLAGAAEVRPLLQPAFEVEPNSEPLVETLVPTRSSLCSPSAMWLPAAARRSRRSATA